MNCSECGVEIVEDGDYCEACGADLTQTPASAEDASFLDRYGAKPLPLASERGEIISLYGNLLANIPVVGGIMKLFSGISFWCYSIWVKIFVTVTGGADVTKRFEADFNYLKDNFYSGYNGTELPPDPPEGV